MHIPDSAGKIPRPVPVVFGLLLALIPATSGTARGLLLPGLKVSDVLALVLLVLVLVAWQGRWVPLDGLGGVVLLYALLYVFFTMINFARRPELEGSDLLKEMLGAPQYLLLYVMAFAIGQRAKNLMVWFGPSLLIASAIACLAVLQIVDVGPVREVLALLTGNDEIVNPVDWKVYRGSGLFPSWHAMGMYLCVHVVLASACLAKGSFSRANNRLFTVSIAICGVGILTTATASPIIVAAVAVLWFSLSGRRFMVVFAMLTAALIVVSSTPLGANLIERLQMQTERGDSSLLPQSFGFRLEIWARDFLPIINENLWTGYGPVGPNEAELFPYMESMYITLLMSGGAGLLLVFILLMCAGIARMGNIARSVRDPAVSAPARGMLFMLLALVAVQFIHPYLNDAGAAPMIFIALGLISGLARFAPETTRAGAVEARSKTALPQGV